MTSLAIFFTSARCLRILSPKDCFFAIANQCHRICSRSEPETTWSLCESCAYEGQDYTFSVPNGPACCDDFSSLHSGRFRELPCNPESLSFERLFLWPLIPTCRSNVDAIRACFFEHSGNSILVDRLDGLCRYFQRYPTILFRDVKTLLLNVDSKNAFGLVVRVGNMVSGDGALSSKYISSRHQSGGLAFQKMHNPTVGRLVHTSTVRYFGTEPQIYGGGNTLYKQSASRKPWFSAEFV